MKRDEKRGVYSLIGVLGITVLALLMFGNVAGAAPFAYIAHNQLSGTVTVIDLATNTAVPVIIPVGGNPQGVAVSPDGTKAYVTNSGSGDVSVIDKATNTVTNINVGSFTYPRSIAITPDGKKVYVTTQDSSYLGTVSVIDTATNTVRILSVDNNGGLGINPDGTKVYVTDGRANCLRIIDSATDTIIGAVGTGIAPQGFGLFIGGQKAIPTTPTITWSNPADITYGTSLSSTQLNAASSVPGTFTYTPLSGTILSAGTQTLHVDFTPTDTANYNSTSKEVTINVLKATPTITWNNPSDIISGTALSSAQLNAASSVPGTFTYTPDSGTVLSTGTQTLHVDFTPTDTVNYTTASKEVTINVGAAPLKNPTITWSNPKDIIYGTALSTTQLNAIASVPGTLTYIPPSGTVLSAGTQTLKVDFTPTDIANYNTATQTVTINVLTHVQGIQQITAKVKSLNLVPEQANLLTVKLDTATKNLNAGNTLGAATELNAFTNQVNAFINNGKISSSEGRALIDDTNDLIKAMDNIFNFPAASVPEFPSVALPVVAMLGLVMIFGRKKE